MGVVVILSFGQGQEVGLYDVGWGSPAPNQLYFKNVCEVV